MMEIFQMILLEELKNKLWPNDDVKIVFLLDNKLCTGTFFMKNERNEATYYHYRHNLYNQGFSKVKLINKNFNYIMDDFYQRIINKYGENIEIEKVLSDFKEVVFVEMIETIKENTQEDTEFFNYEYIPQVVYNYKEIGANNKELDFYYIGDKDIKPVSLVEYTNPVLNFS